MSVWPSYVNLGPTPAGTLKALEQGNTAFVANLPRLRALVRPLAILTKNYRNGSKVTV